MEWREISRGSCREGIVAAIPQHGGASGAIRQRSGEVELLAREAHGLAEGDKVTFTIGRTVKSGRRIAFRVARATAPSTDTLGPLPPGRTPHLCHGGPSVEPVRGNSTTSTVHDRRTPQGRRQLLRPWAVTTSLLDEMVTQLTKAAARRIVTVLTAGMMTAAYFLLHMFGMI